MKKATSVENYILEFPEEVQERLTKIRTLIKKTAPKAEEVISYGMPAYKLNGMLVYFAAHKNHIGLYPMASGISAFKKELSPYKSARGSVQFPHEEKLPTTLISKIMKFRVKKNLEKQKIKKIK